MAIAWDSYGFFPVAASFLSPCLPMPSLPLLKYFFFLNRFSVLSESGKYRLSYTPSLLFFFLLDFAGFCSSHPVFLCLCIFVCQKLYLYNYFRNNLRLRIISFSSENRRSAPARGRGALTSQVCFNPSSVISSIGVAIPSRPCGLWLTFRLSVVPVQGLSAGPRCGAAPQPSLFFILR